MSIAIGLGLSDYPFSSSDFFWDWVDMCEAGGVDSLWQTDRIVSRTPILETVTTMAAIAGATKRIKFGMNVVSLGLRDPLILAKQCATIDVLSKGRLLPAFGVGNIRAPEWKAISLPTKGRGQRTNEGLHILARLWTEDEVTVQGRFYTYQSVSISPKPVQRRLPMWIGGSSPAAVQRTARFGTGWQAGFETPAEVACAIRAIKDALLCEGRSIAEDHYGASFSYRFGSWSDPAVERSAQTVRERLGRKPHEVFAIGDAGHILDRIGQYVAGGASKFILRPIGDGDADILAQSKMLVNEILPEIKKAKFGRVVVSPK
jgi:probable F420-dependent oxidoreductase